MLLDTQQTPERTLPGWSAAQPLHKGTSSSQPQGASMQSRLSDIGCHQPQPRQLLPGLSNMPAQAHCTLPYGRSNWDWSFIECKYKLLRGDVTREQERPTLCGASTSGAVGEKTSSSSPSSTSDSRSPGSLGAGDSESLAAGAGSVSGSVFAFFALLCPFLAPGGSSPAPSCREHCSCTGLSVDEARLTAEQLLQVVLRSATLYGVAALQASAVECQGLADGTALLVTLRCN